MQNWLSLRDRDLAELDALVESARALKNNYAQGGSSGHTARTHANPGQASAARPTLTREHASRILRDRILGMVFFNPSLRTRVSFESAMLRFGGHAISLSVGGDTWQLEYRDGAVMNADRAEHIREAAPVLSRYCDVLGVRTFARMVDPAEDAADGVLRAFAKYATVPVISLESAIEHPCQGLADRLTLSEKLQEPRGKRFTLTWAPHIKGLPMAVPHSAILAAASAGMHVTIAHPRGYELNSDIVAHARRWCETAGASLRITHDQQAACRDADALYVKSWGSAE